MSITKTPLRYPGGKSGFYPLVRTLLIENKLSECTYIEPFAGGAGIAMQLLLNGDVKQIVINDIDNAIYSFWYSALYQSGDLCEMIRNVDVTMKTWTKQKEIYNNQEAYSPLEVGFSALFLNRTNISGIIKGGVIGGGLQTGKYKIDARFNRLELIRKISGISERRSDIELTRLDAVEFLQIINQRQDKCFINIDPPYVKKGAQLYKNSYREEDHEKLASIIYELNHKWIVTYDMCSLISGLYRKYRYGYLDIIYTVKKSRKAQEYVFLCDGLEIPSPLRVNRKGYICTIKSPEMS